MALFTKQSSILQSEEFYTEWLQDLQVWTLYMDLAKVKQGAAVFLSLPQNICEYVSYLLIADIDRAERLKLIMDKLDKIYLQDSNTSAYIDFKDFYP